MHVATSDVHDGGFVARTRSGDTRSFGLLYDRYKADVWKLAFFTLGNRHDAEDCMQETFLKAYRALGQHRLDSSVRNWLLAICRNVCLDRLRASPRQSFLPAEYEEHPAPDRDHEAQMDLRRALAELPPDDREAFFVVDVLGCGSEEAARIVDARAASTVRSRVARARRHLVAALGETPAPDPASAAEIWGLYQTGTASAIVVSFDPAGNGRSDANHRSPSDRAEGRAPVALRNGRSEVDLMRFFERVDGCIPEGRRVVAVSSVRRPLPSAAHQEWLAAHPRWQLRQVPTRSSWLTEAARLLRLSPSGTVADRARVLTLLTSGRPFLWTHVE